MTGSPDYGFVHRRLTPADSCPLLDLPADGATDLLVERQGFQWHAVNGATAYKLYVSLNGGAFNLAATVTDIAALVDLNTASATGSWYVNPVVKGVEQDCSGGARTFTTADPPFVPVIFLIESPHPPGFDPEFVTFSNNDQTVTYLPDCPTIPVIASDQDVGVRSVYMEVSIDEMPTLSAPSDYFDFAFSPLYGNTSGADSFAGVYSQFDGAYIFGDIGAVQYDSFEAGDRCMLAIDVASNGAGQFLCRVWVGVRGAWYNGGDPAAGTNPTEQFTTVNSQFGTGPIIPRFMSSAQFGAGNLVMTIHTAGDFTYPLPAGFSAWTPQ